MKTILITGANKGIGFAAAKQLAQLGHQIYLGSRNIEKGNKAIDDLKNVGIFNVEMIQLDVTDINSILKAKKELENNIEVLDVLINNAGISGSYPQQFSLVKMENIRNVFDTNFFGSIQVTQQFMGLLKRSNAPSIINVSSTLGSLTLHGDPQHSSNWDRSTVYSCSKTVLNAFTVMLANELKDTDFRINSVSPGYTATDLNEFKGVQHPDEAAKIIVKFAVVDDDRTGTFFNEKEEEVPW